MKKDLIFAPIMLAIGVMLFLLRVTSGFDLSLYTCTTGGTGRVTVRCNAL